MREKAYEWTVNIATPAALVAGAALASTFEVVPEILNSLNSDSKSPWLHLGYVMTCLLLAASFASEIFVVYVATVTGTMLLSGGARVKHKLEVGHEASSPTELLHRDVRRPVSSSRFLSAGLPCTPLHAHTIETNARS